MATPTAGMPQQRPIRTFEDAEANAALWMRHLGFPTARVTRPGADGGIDVEAAGAFAQVKARTGAASRPEVQQLIGAVGRGTTAQLFFFSFGGFTREALAFAEANGVCAYTFQLDGSVAPQTSAALAALAAAPGWTGPTEDVASARPGNVCPAAPAGPAAAPTARGSGAGHGTRVWCSICERSVPGNADGSAPILHKAKRDGVLQQRGWRCNGVDRGMIPSR